EIWFSDRISGEQLRRYKSLEVLIRDTHDVPIEIGINQDVASASSSFSYQVPDPEVEGGWRYARFHTHDGVNRHLYVASAHPLWKPLFDRSLNIFVHYGMKFRIAPSAPPTSGSLTIILLG